MTEHDDSEDYASAATEAVEWYARLRSPDVSEIEAVRFRAWLAGNPSRRQEFDAVDAFWEDLSAIEHSPEVARIRRDIATRKRRRYLALGAIVLVALFGTWGTWQLSNAGHYVTRVGEQRMVPMADGSLAMLNTSTEIRLYYTQDRREVQLVHGQVSFDVKKDPSRPFVVVAGGGEVRALGTVFDVYKGADKVTVTLIEGKVVVTPDRFEQADSRAISRADELLRSGATESNRTETSEIVLHAGEQMSFAATATAAKLPNVVKLGTADVLRVTAWRSRKLNFSDTPLFEAIAEANRYSQDQIVLKAPDLDKLRISGTFEAGKTEEFVEGLEAYFRFKVERDNNHRIILTTPAQ